MGYISVDLGTTNIKVAAFDDSLKMLAIETVNVKYYKDEYIVEFDPEKYFKMVLSAIKRCCQTGFKNTPYPIRQIILTGQAESLVVIDSQGKTLRNGISWLDMRSKVECEELKKAFAADIGYQITGQPEIIPTWPITKILWLRKHEKEIFSQISKFLLLKDFIQFRLTGELFGEYSIYNFSHYFDITKKSFYTEILAYCGVSPDQLPQLLEPCTQIGPLKRVVAESLGLNSKTVVNVGTLDHFSGMIGTGNIHQGIISESTGTLLGIATMVPRLDFSGPRLAYHYGPFKDSYVLLAVIESGGICLEWFKNNFAGSDSYKDIDENASRKDIPNELIFLPYITGINSPDFNPDAKGVFFGIQAKHDKYDFALAIMEGVTHLLKKNIDVIEKTGIKTNTIISTGGGAKSSLWSQMKADITGRIVKIPKNEEASCLGSAMIGAVTDGKFADYQAAVDHCVSFKKTYEPREIEAYRIKHILFNKVYDQSLPCFSMPTK